MGFPSSKQKSRYTFVEKFVAKVRGRKGGETAEEKLGGAFDIRKSWR